MNNPSLNTNPKLIVKVIQVPAARKSNGKLSLNYGEARVLNNIMLKHASVYLDNVVTELGKLYPARMVIKGKEVVFDQYATHLVFLPNRQEIMSNKFDEVLFLDAVEAFCRAHTNQDITLLSSTPGAFEVPNKEDRATRWDAFSEIVHDYGLSTEFKFVPADLPPSQLQKIEPVDIGELEVNFEEGTLLLVGNRRLESGSAKRKEVLRQAAQVILQATKPSSVVTPAAVGMSLAIAEEATAQGIPVQLVYINETNNWAEETLARLNNLLSFDTVSVTGEASYVKGKIPTTIRKLNALAKAAKAKRVVIDDAAGSEARIMTGALNFWSAVEAFLKANGETLSDVQAVSSVQRNGAYNMPASIDEALGIEEQSFVF